MRRLQALSGVILIAVLVACGQAAAPTATPVPPTATTAPPTPTLAPPTATPQPPTPTLAPSPTTVPAQAAAKPAGAATAVTKPAESAKPTTGGGFGSPVKPSAALPPEIIKAAEAMNALKSYRMKLEGVSDGEKIMMTIEYVAPDRRRISSDGKLLGGTEELIIIANTVYVRTGTTWTKLEGDFARQAQSGMSSMFDFGEIINDNAGASYTRAGTEVIDNENCTVFNVVEQDTTGKIWIAIRDNTIRRIDFKSADGSGMVTVSQINQSITIEAPKI